MGIPTAINSQMRQQVGGTGGELDLANPISEGGQFSTLNNTMSFAAY